jgi:hypothetical protein
MKIRIPTALFFAATLIGITINTLGQQEDKKYYSPADKFPPDARGTKLIGHFIVDRNSVNGTIYLKADESSGEKDVSRRFNPKNFNPQVGQLITFTKDFPLFIASKSRLGDYDVVIHQQKVNTAQPTPVNSVNSQQAIESSESEEIPIPTGPPIIADPNATRFKGLYIGMPYQEAINVAYSIPLKNKLKNLEEATKIPEIRKINRALGKSDKDIVGDISIHFQNGVIATMTFDPSVFNAQDMQIEDFCKSFMQAYNIDELKPFYTSTSDNPLFPSLQKVNELTGDDHGYKYTSPQGFELTINSHKVVTIKSVPKKSERSFN